MLRQPPAGLWGGLGPPLLACPRKTSPRPAGGRWVPGCTLSRAHRVSAQVLEVGERESSGPLRNKWRLGVHGWICSEGGLPGLYTVIGLGLATGGKKKKKISVLAQRLRCGATFLRHSHIELLAASRAGICSPCPGSSVLKALS